MRNRLLILVLGVLLISTAAAGAWCAFVADGRVVEKKVLLCYGPDDDAEIRDASVGDVIQITPFTFPLVPKYMSATLKPTLKSLALEVIGQSSGVETPDGRSAQTIFLLAREPGEATLELRLVDSDGNDLGKTRSYKVTVLASAD